MCRTGTQITCDRPVPACHRAIVQHWLFPEWVSLGSLCAPTVRANSCSAGASGSHALQARKWRSRASTTGDMTVAYLQRRASESIGYWACTKCARSANKPHQSALEGKAHSKSHTLNLL